MPDRFPTSRHLLVPLMMVVLLVAVSPVPAGRGNLGEPRILTGSQYDVTIGLTVFTHVITPGETNTNVNADLVSQMNTHISFNAAVSSDPFDPNAVAFEVLTARGEEVQDLQICETSASATTLGVYIPMGKDTAMIGLPTAMNADGTYTLTLRRWDGAQVVHTYNTSVSPNNTVSGLISSLVADLTADGFTLVQGATYLSIRRAGDMMTYVKIVATDTGIINTCTRMLPSAGVVPTLSQYGFFALILLMTGAAMLMLRRKSGQDGAPSRS